MDEFGTLPEGTVDEAPPGDFGGFEGVLGPDHYPDEPPPEGPYESTAGSGVTIDPDQQRRLDEFLQQVTGRGGPVVPPPIDENRNGLGYVPDQLTYRVLTEHGWRPEAAQEFVDRVPVQWTTRRDFAGVYRPDLGTVGINDTLAADPYLDSTLQHEAQHAWDADLRPGPQLNVPSKDEMLALGGDERYPIAAEAARATMMPGRVRPGAFATSGLNSYGESDPTHYTTNLYERVNYDPTAFPPELAGRYFSFSDQSRPSFVALQQAMERERSQMGEAQMYPEYTPEQQAAMERYFRQTPFYMSGEDDIDPRWLDALLNGPPAIFGPHDRQVSDLGGYVDRDTGEYIPFPRER
jgi:hypothetical protein